MADDWAPIAGGQDYGEGIYTSHPLAMSWGGILNFTIDMYGGAGGQMMAYGGITGMPDQNGSSGSVVPGADGGSSTPPNWDNELLSPNGLPVPAWTPHGSANPNAISNLYALAAAEIAYGAAIAPHQVNSGLWGVPGTVWTDKWPVPQQAKADKYQTMPTKHHVGPAVDPYFEIHPSVDWTNLCHNFYLLLWFDSIKEKLIIPKSFYYGFYNFISNSCTYYFCNDS